MDANRRNIFGLGAGLVSAALLAPPRALAQDQAVDEVIVTEDQYGDPTVTQIESVTFDAIKIQSIGGTRAEFKPRVVDFDKRFLAAARSYLGKGRQNARGEIADLLSLFKLKFEMNSKPVPFCAAGASCMAAIAYATAHGAKVGATNWEGPLGEVLPDIDHYHFFPSPSVLDMYYVARGKHRWMVNTVMPKPGWLVVYDWKGNGGADHVGIIESATATTLSTIEFNTGDKNFRDGGQIARKQRVRNRTVKGFINTSLKTRI